MNAFVHIGSIISTVILFFYLFASNDKGLAYRLASKIIGKPPQPGDGAFQFPLGWLIIIVVGTAIGWFVGSLIMKLLSKT